MQRFNAVNEAVLHQLSQQFMGYQEIMEEYHVCRATAYNYLRSVPANARIKVLFNGRSFTMARRHAISQAHRRARLQLSPYTREKPAP